MISISVRICVTMHVGIKEYSFVLSMTDGGIARSVYVHEVGAMSIENVDGYN